MVISNIAYQQGRPDVILMAITSQIRQPLAFGEYLLEDWQQAGLLKPSVLKPLIATLEQSQIVKVMGQLPASDLQGLQNVLQTILGRWQKAPSRMGAHIIMQPVPSGYYSTL